MDTETSREVLADLRLPARYILHVGSDRPHKNLARLVDAWATGDTPRATHLVLAGPRHRDGRSIRSAATGARLRNIRVLGRVADEILPALYSGAAGYVHPSIEEGFAFPVLEAMACGAPVACSATASLLELTDTAAIHFDPLNVGSIAAALRQLLDDGSGRADRIRAGLARAAELDWDRTAAATVDIYREIAPPRSQVA